MPQYVPGFEPIKQADAKYVDGFEPINKQPEKKKLSPAEEHKLLLEQQGTISAAPSPIVNFAQQTLMRAGLPASRAGVEALADKSFLRRQLLPLSMINLPFAGVGEGVQRGAEAIGANPVDAGSSTADKFFSIGNIAELGSSYGAGKAADAVDSLNALKGAFQGPVVSGAVRGPVGARQLPPLPPSAELAKRPAEAAPTVLSGTGPATGRTPALPQPPTPPLLPTPASEVPSQLAVGFERAGVRGPQLAGPYGQPVATQAPSAISQGTSEIVDQFGRKVPTRPPVHVDPGDVVAPSMGGPVPTALDAATARRGLPPTRKSELPVVEPADPSKAAPRGFDELYANPFMNPALIGQALKSPLSTGAAGAAVGGVGGAELGETPGEKLALGITGAIIGGTAGALAPTALERWNKRMGEQIKWAQRADTNVRLPEQGLMKNEIHKVGARLPQYTGGPLSLANVGRTVSAITDTLQRHNIATTPGTPLTLELVRAMRTQPQVITELSAELQMRGGSLMDVAQLFVDNAQSPGALTKLSNTVSRVLQQEALTNPDAAKLLRSVIDERPVMGAWDAAGHFVRRDINAWRGLLVAAWRTALRNLGGQQTRIGIEAVEHLIESSLMTATGWGGAIAGGAAGAAQGETLPEQLFYGTLGAMGGTIAGGQLHRAAPILPALSGAGPELSAASRYAWEYAMFVARPTARRQINRVLEAYPAFANKLLQQFNGDVAKQLHKLGPGLARGEGGLLHPMGPIATRLDQAHNWLDKGVGYANKLNEWQEVLTRKAAMRTALLGALEKRGIKNLDQIPASQIPVEDIATAVEHALRMTFAQAPSKKAPFIMEKLFAHLLEKTGSSGTASAVVHVAAGMPFLRYMFNASRFVAERPFTSAAPAMRTIMRLASPSERAAMTRGDFAPISKMMGGAAALLGAWQFVNSEHAGDGVLEAKTPYGPIDLKVLGPIIPAYVLAARTIKEWQDGNLAARWPEISKNAAELRYRLADVSLGVDRFIQAIPNLGDEFGSAPLTPLLPDGQEQTRLDSFLEMADKPTRVPRRFAGDTLAGALQFMTTAQRLFAAFGQHIPALEAMAREEDTKRDVKDAPFTGPIRAKIPGLSQGLPAQTSALREGPIPVENPLRLPNGFPLPADLIGVQGAPDRTPGEAEALRLGMKPREIAGQPSGYAGADRLERGVTGMIADPVTKALTDAEGYQGLPNVEKSIVFKRVMEIARQSANEAIQRRIATKMAGGEALSQEERETIDVMLKSIDPRVRELMRREGIKVPR